MAIATQTEPLTYEQYMAEGEIFKRYDILDGVRIFMANPTRRHQEILGNIYTLLRSYRVTSGQGQVLLAPCDVLIRRSPLRTRQPDVLFISNARLTQNGDSSDPTPLVVAPELVVEILSPSETRTVRADKLADYCAVGVQECWVVYPDKQAVEVLRLTQDGAEIVATYQSGQALHSAVFSDLAVPVAEIFVP